MKTKLFITIMVLGFVVKSWGQKQEEIEINPFGTDKPISKTEKGNSVKFKISNVNTFKINGFTESKPLSVNFEVPEIFNDFINSKESENNGNNENSNISYNVSDFKKKFETIKRDLDENILTKELANNLLTELKKVQDEIFQNNLSNFKTTFSVFVSKYNAVHQQIELEGKLIEQVNDSIFVRDTTVLKKNTKEYFKSVYGSKTTEEAKKVTVTDLNNLMIEYAQLQKIYDELNKTLEKDSVVLNGKLESGDKKTTINIEKATINQDRKKYFSEEMIFAKKVFETILDVKNRNEIIKKAQQGIDWYNKIDQESFTIYTDAIQLNDDETTITPKLKFSNGNVAHEFQPLTIKTFGGIKVNFSTGYLMSFIGDDNFSTFKDNTGNTIGIVESNKNAITHSLGGLVHVYPNWKNSPQLGLSAGASLATNGNLGFYFGSSLFFLEKNRLVLTGGYSFIKLKQLNSSNLNKISGNRYEFVSSTDTEIRYDDVYKGGWFIGVTYNLSK